MPRGKKKPSSTALVPSTLEAELAPQRTEAEAVLQAIQKVDLSTQANRDKAGVAVAEFRSRVKALEDQRKTITGPINEAKRAVDALFNPVKEYWQACDRALTGRLLEAAAEAEAAQRKALALVAETGGNTDVATLAIAHDTPRAPEGLQERETWDFEMVNSDLVEDEFWILNESAVRKRVDSGIRELSGFRIFKVKSYTKAR